MALPWTRQMASLSSCLALRMLSIAPPQLRRQLQPEAPREEFHVTVVLLRERVPVRVAEHLRLRRQAPDARAAHEPLAAEVSRRVDPVLAVLHPVDAVAGFVEGDGVDIDFEPRAVGEHERVRRLAPEHTEAPRREKLPEPRHVLNGQDDVNVLVWSRLRPEQS